MISHDIIADIRERADKCEESLIKLDNVEDRMKCLRLLRDARIDLDIAEDLVIKFEKM
jgi:hypothetical protein